MKKISHNLPNFLAKVLSDDIHRANQFHVHPYHHLLTYPHDVISMGLVRGGHLAHGLINFCWGMTKEVSLICATFEPKTSQMTSKDTVPDDNDIHINNQFHAHPYHRFLRYPDDDNQLLGKVIWPMQVKFWLGRA